MAKNIIKATSVVLVINLIVKLLGFLRETFIAGAFGASDVTDAYLSAYTLPYFLQAILGAALVAVMVPVLTNYLVKGERGGGLARCFLRIEYHCLVVGRPFSVRNLAGGSVGRIVDP